MTNKLKETGHALFHTPGGVLGPKDYLSYSFAGFGQNMVWGMMNAYLMIFYTDVFLIPSSVVGTMFLVAKLWDAINDPIMGTFIDKTRTKWGKMRPYLLYTPIPIALVTVLIFTAPNFSDGGKIVYMYLTYIAWGMIYTVCDVPYWSLSAAMTPKPQERTKLLSITNFICVIGIGVPTVLVPALMALQKQGVGGPVATNKGIYFFSAVVIAVVGCALLSLAFFGTKERVPQNEQKPTFRESMRYLVSNKPLMMILLCNLLAFPRGLSGMMTTYVATYLLGGGEWVFILGLPVTIGGALSYAITPYVMKRFGSIKAYLLASVYSLIPMGLLFLFGYQHVSIILVFLFLNSLAGGVMNVAPVVLIGDCVDYSEWKNGQRSEGVSFSIKTFMGKASSALQGWVGGLLLTAIGYIAPLASASGELVNQVQSTSTLQGMWAMFTILPVAASLLSLIPLFFYDLKGGKLEQMQTELAERRASEEAAAAK